jgi:DNA-binding CsgD family transcriptional regulator
MIPIIKDYSLFFKYIEKYLPIGFKGINHPDPFMQDLEEMMEANNQFFYIGDVIKLDITYTSKRSLDMMGIAPEELNLYHFFEATHPNDLQRLSYGRAKLIKMAQELFLVKKGSLLLSTNFRMRNPQGDFSSILIQCYLFYTTIPYNTVIIFKLHTNIDWYKQIKHGYHYYVGDDLNNLRYPDEELLSIGNIFTQREFEVLKLIASGHSSEQIADVLFISQNTVSTHRRNILEKTGRVQISDLIYELQERGVL